LKKSLKVFWTPHRSETIWWHSGQGQLFVLILVELVICASTFRGIVQPSVSASKVINSMDVSKSTLLLHGHRHSRPIKEDQAGEKGDATMLRTKLTPMA